jgi:hypothetical protein
MLKTIFGEKTVKTLQWFSMLKSREISVKGHECLEHLFQGKHMKKCVIK